MREFTARGFAIIMISSELPEIIGMCDRVAVFRQGAHRCDARRLRADQCRGRSCATQPRENHMNTPESSLPPRRHAARQADRAEVALHAPLEPLARCSIRSSVCSSSASSWSFACDSFLSGANFVNVAAPGLDHRDHRGRHDLRDPDRRHRSFGRRGHGVLGHAGGRADGAPACRGRCAGLSVCGRPWLRSGATASSWRTLECRRSSSPSRPWASPAASA